MIIGFKDKKPQWKDSAFVAENATVSGAVYLGEYSSVWFQAVVRGDNASITIGEATNIQDGVVVHVDEGYPVVVGSRCVIGHRAILHGCTLEDECLIGMGAIIMNGAKIGAGSIIGAGAVISEGTIVPPGTLYVGVPARQVKVLPPESRLKIIEGANHYVAKIKDYAAVNSVKKKEERR